MSKYNKARCIKSVYLDNNGTTLMCKQAIEATNTWLSCYNASTDSKVAKPARDLLEKATDDLLKHCGVSTASHTAVFTSGGSESNCFIIRACVKAFKKKLAERGSADTPHIVASQLEHHSTLECLRDLTALGDIEVSYVQPRIYGNILAEDVEREIRPSTCLVVVMAANNEIPVINNISEIGRIAHKHKVPLHSDCVQIFGKIKFNVMKQNIDSLSASAHKFYGPKGVGVLILNNDLITGYGITAEINGSQQSGLRGGTENIAGIAGMMAALDYCFKSKRQEKNARLFALRQRFLERIGKHFTIGEYAAYLTTDQADQAEKPDLELISLGPPEDKPAFILPNTVLLAICKNRGKPFCNVELKKYLDSKGFVISLGSACNTKSDKASHVLTAIGAPPVVKRGVIRVSFGDSNKPQEVDQFVAALKSGIEKQLADL